MNALPKSASTFLLYITDLLIFTYFQMPIQCSELLLKYISLFLISHHCSLFFCSKMQILIDN